MKSPPQNPGSASVTSRAASVSSKAARCSGDILEVSMATCGSSGAVAVLRVPPVLGVALVGGSCVAGVSVFIK